MGQLFEMLMSIRLIFDIETSCGQILSSVEISIKDVDYLPCDLV